MSANVFATTDVVPLRGGSDLFELAFGHLYGDGDHALVPFRQHVETVVDRAGDTVAGVLAFHSFHVTADLLLGHSVKALAAVENKEVNEDLENVVEASIFLSGFGAICGGLAAAHAVNDGLGAIPQIHANGTSHGEKVAFGLLVQLILEKAPQEEWDTVLRFMQTVGLPTTLAELGFKDFVEADLRRAAKIAASPKEFTKNVRADITADEVYDAILAADKAGARQ